MTIERVINPSKMKTIKELINELSNFPYEFKVFHSYDKDKLIVIHNETGNIVHEIDFPYIEQNTDYSNRGDYSAFRPDFFTVVFCHKCNTENKLHISNKAVKCSNCGEMIIKQDIQYAREISTKWDYTNFIPSRQCYHEKCPYHYINEEYFNFI